MPQIAYKPGAKGKAAPWIKARSTGGVCFTLSYLRLEGILKTVKRLREDQFIERVEIDKNGITVFLNSF